MVDSIYRTRSLGVASEGLPDQYADGKAARVWEFYIGQKTSRTENYKNFLCSSLRDKGCKDILDVACGTGVDSILLLEEGFHVKSVDASDKMLKYALRERWRRRQEPAFDNWEIEEANWLTLCDDINKPRGQDGYDAVICLGNSFAHLLDFDGDLANHKLAITNMANLLKPGGVLMIDHRNYDYILDSGKSPAKNIYYNSQYTSDISTSLLYVNGKPNIVTLDYTMDLSELIKQQEQDENWFTANYSLLKNKRFEGPPVNRFRLSYYPHRLDAFKQLLSDSFDGKCHQTVFGDFQPLDSFTYKGDDAPAFYIHIVQKML
ncbi:PREDICTED: glycine N-methyltransferase-like [Priapulus caudatus]|uniref:Glycine N-methyltransferase n=1 Tax=Priapulus caudatus TaxID=37621 RepID=A0ABM1EV61_PRICU|nr:PREDICTED: glycine N-methyltransferase-like [Priapulus caudatus]